MKKATNYRSLSETMYQGRLYSFQILYKKSHTTSSTVTVVWIGIKWACFDMESTTVITVSYLEDSGSSIIKSILKTFYQESGADSR